MEADSHGNQTHLLSLPLFLKRSWRQERGVSPFFGSFLPTFFNTFTLEINPLVHNGNIIYLTQDVEPRPSFAGGQYIRRTGSSSLG